jgi:hypothetical protein
MMAQVNKQPLIDWKRYGLREERKYLREQAKREEEAQSLMESEGST